MTVRRTTGSVDKCHQGQQVTYNQGVNQGTYDIPRPRVRGITH